MANLPKADELIGSTVTQQQFKTKLKQLVENIDRSYSTLAEANADIANIGVGAKVDTDDSGRYYKATVGATSLTKSPYDPVSTSNKYSDQKTDEVKLNLSDLNSAPDQNIVAVLVDKDNKVLIGYDTVEDKAIIAGYEPSNAKFPKPAMDNAFEEKLLSAAVNHFLFYGQSLSIGATATAILSTAQPYSNLTFNSGVRTDTVATGVMPLVEAWNNTSSNRGETSCSGAANYVSRSLALGDINPSSHVIFASTAGQGGTPIADLVKGSTRYAYMLGQVTKARDLAGPDFKVQLVAWLQGETDLDQDKSYESYKSALEQLQIDMNVDIKAITGQTDDIRLVTYQCSYKAQISKNIALAQLHLAQENPNFYFSTPTYRIPYYTDNTHLTNVGYKLIGAYFGKIYRSVVIDNKNPGLLSPKLAVYQGKTITVSFDVPQLPLRFETSEMGVTTDYGFKVTDSSGNKLNIDSIEVGIDTVKITLENNVPSDAKVRYALDYLAAGALISSGGCGNLCDSSAEVVTISDKDYTLFNACPSFELTVTQDKGI